MPDPVRIDELREDDLEETIAFRRAQGGAAPAAVDAQSVATDHWFLFENPELRPDVPRGWVARDTAGRVVGLKHCSPERFRCGDQSFVLLMGGGFFVDAAHRGLGLRLMRAYLALEDRFSHFASTMNAVSGALYERYGGYPIPHTEHELLGVLRWSPVLEEALAARLPGPARGLARWLARPAKLRPAAVRRDPDAGRLVELDDEGALARLDLAWPDIHRPQITSARRPDFLAWRYLRGPDRRRGLFVYESATGERALVGTRLSERGRRGQIRTLTLLDCFGDLSDEALAALPRVLAARFAGEADLIAFRGQPPVRQRALERAGFVRRDFARPIGVCIDRAGRLPTRDWYLVPADGDMAT